VGKRTSHPPGTFSWVDLATTDAEAAKAFYTGLFGWKTEEGDTGGGAMYTTCRLGGDAVCGIFEVSANAGAAGVPPAWTSHVTVADADAAASRAKELGGRLVSEARDVLDAGRMAVLEDPQGAVFAVWQPLSRIGAERVNDIGYLCMNELATVDLEAARSFYENLFGWRTEVVGAEPDQMVVAYNGDTLNASFSDVEEGAPPHWRPYFTVESPDAILERVRELGGEEVLAPLEIFDGTIAIARDPQGAIFALFAGDVDP
jgi:uncharacterized protein